MTNELTPDDHRRVRANAFLMWLREEAGWLGFTSSRTADDTPKPPDPNAVHPHRRGWYYDPRTHKAHRAQRAAVVAKAQRGQR